MKIPKTSLTFLALTLFASPALQADGPAPSRDQRRFEVGFLTMMIDHHFGGTKLAELCAGRTVHAELQELCDDVIAAQTAEIAEMQSWLQDWYGLSHEPEVDRKTQRQVQFLSSLTGEPFEKAFMTILIEHHAMALEEARECLLRAYHPEMLNMCAMMAGAQGEEIAMLRIWLCQWYNVCDLREGRHKHGRGGRDD